VKLLIIFVIAFLMIAACARPVPVDPPPDMSPAGFWSGLLHGWSAPISFIISLFNDNVAVYASYNNGNWYILGFLIGIGAFSWGCCECKKKDD
jgi:hypothetical protein